VSFRIAASRESIYYPTKLSQGDKRYAGDVARVEASLEELEKKARSK
jgi:hypothetical protein